jgi:hypothetical protein
MRLACAAAFALLLVAAPALAASDVNPRVSPKQGNPDTVFRVGFTAPYAAGPGRGYSIKLVAGRGGGGCTHEAFQAVDEARAGERIRLAFSPAEPWCRGKGRGTIYLHDYPYCNEGDPCPAFPSSMRPIARFAFRVRSSGS